MTARCLNLQSRPTEWPGGWAVLGVDVCSASCKCAAVLRFMKLQPRLCRSHVCLASCSCWGCPWGWRGAARPEQGDEAQPSLFASCGCQANSAEALAPGRGIGFNSHTRLGGFDFPVTP